MGDQKGDLGVNTTAGEGLPGKQDRAQGEAEGKMYNKQTKGSGR